MRDARLVIADIKELVREKGYIYALCMILFEDFYVDLKKIHEVNHQERLSVKETSLLLGFLVQQKIDCAIPNTPQDLIRLKEKTYELMTELHHSLIPPAFKDLGNLVEERYNPECFRKAAGEPIKKGNILVEAIFYSGTGAYDFQYLDFLERKYKYDKEWLSANKRFDIEKSKNIAIRIKEILQEKSKKINLYGLKESAPRIIEQMKKTNPGKNWGKRIKQMLPFIEFYQYVSFFYEHSKDKENLNINKIGEDGWKSFYKNLLESFVIRKTDFIEDLGIDSFLDNFSISAEKNLNSQFQDVGDFNLIDARPIIQLDEERYFVPFTFLLFEAIYESPFYWMWKEDKSYRDQLGQNRGQTGEEITYDFLSCVFGKERTYRSVKILEKKGHHVTDIDVLCILGSKALCVQVKSKKLTQLARTGNDKQLQKDFQGAVQDAYEQGLVSRQRILERDAKFFNKGGKEITFSEEIDEIYIVGVTTENYPSLIPQFHLMLDKKNDDPFPLFFTIFDLEVIVHYLRDPYDFLYYIRQRISLINYYMAKEEIHLLGYHLRRKLWKIPDKDLVIIEADFGALIDRNYYPIKAGLEISDEGDVIKARWKSEIFDRLCDTLKTLDQPKATDIIFCLLDFSQETRKNLVDMIIQTKQRTLQDGKIHDFSILPDEEYLPRVGVTYISLSSNNSEELAQKLLSLCPLRKYKSSGDVWIGFGSLKSSMQMIDAVVFNNQQWEYDSTLEELSKNMQGKEQAKKIKVDKSGKSFV